MSRTKTVVRGSVASCRPVIVGAKLMDLLQARFCQAGDRRGRRVGLVFNALSPHWRVPENDVDGQAPWFTARIASLIG